jgi:hypothetical protein
LQFPHVSVKERMENTAPDPTVLPTIFDCDFSTGELRWKPRPVELFADERACKMWNTRFAGKRALTTISFYGYPHGALFNRGTLAHRVIWALAHGRWPEGQIDHINGNRADNRLCNLREVKPSDNQRNMKPCEQHQRAHRGGKACVGWLARPPRSEICRPISDKTRGNRRSPQG